MHLSALLDCAVNLFFCGLEHYLENLTVRVQPFVSSCDSSVENSIANIVRKFLTFLSKETPLVVHACSNSLATENEVFKKWMGAHGTSFYFKML